MLCQRYDASSLSWSVWIGTIATTATHGALVRRRVGRCAWTLSSGTTASVRRAPRRIHTSIAIGWRSRRTAWAVTITIIITSAPFMAMIGVAKFTGTFNPKIVAWCRSPWTLPPRLLHCDETSFKNWLIQIFYTTVSILKAVHCHKAKTTWYPGSRFYYEAAVNNLSLSWEMFFKILLCNTSRETSHIKGISGILCFFISPPLPDRTTGSGSWPHPTRWRWRRIPPPGRVRHVSNPRTDQILSRTNAPSTLHRKTQIASDLQRVGNATACTFLPVENSPRGKRLCRQSDPNRLNQ